MKRSTGGPLRHPDRHRRRPRPTGTTRHCCVTPSNSAAPNSHHWPEQITAHLDRGYDRKRTRELLDEIGFDAEIASKSVPAPIQIGKRRVAESTNSWINGFGQIRRCTDRNAHVIDFYL
jgi:IS5 family transposase